MEEGTTESAEKFVRKNRPQTAMGGGLRPLPIRGWQQARRKRSSVISIILDNHNEISINVAEETDEDDDDDDEEEEKNEDDGKYLSNITEADSGENGEDEEKNEEDESGKTGEESSNLGNIVITIILWDQGQIFQLVHDVAVIPEFAIKKRKTLLTNLAM